MKIALVQAPLVWEQVSENIKNFNSTFETIDRDVDLVILPEMFSSGFTMRPDQAFATMDGELLLWMQKVAKTHQFALTGSVVVKEEEGYYNRLFFVYPDGTFQTYDKRHLFSLAGEEKVYLPGKKRLIVTYKGWRICPLVCYDLRFPAFSRNTHAVYDLLLYVASWPDQRIYAWDSLLKARAIENMSYVIGVNRSGEDEQGNKYTGHSQVLDFLGHYLQEPLKGSQVAYLVLDKMSQDKARKRFGFLEDADVFEME